MAWQGKTVGEICRQIKDPERNGGRSLELLQEHAANDDLVAGGGILVSGGSQLQEHKSCLDDWCELGLIVERSALNRLAEREKAQET